MNEQYARQLAAEVETLKFERDLRNSERGKEMSEGQIGHFVAERRNDMYHSHGCDPAATRYFSE